MYRPGRINPSATPTPVTVPHRIFTACSAASQYHAMHRCSNHRQLAIMLHSPSTASTRHAVMIGVVALVILATSTPSTATLARSAGTSLGDRGTLVNKIGRSSSNSGIKDETLFSRLSKARALERTWRDPAGRFTTQVRTTLSGCLTLDRGALEVWDNSRCFKISKQEIMGAVNGTHGPPRPGRLTDISEIIEIGRFWVQFLADAFFFFLQIRTRFPLLET